MQTTITAYYGEVPVTGWLHRAKPDNNTLIVLIHGHNSNGAEGRYIELAKLFNHHGIDSFRFNVTRQKRNENEYLVTTLGEEIGQAKAIFEKLRGSYEKIIALGHSQGGVIALHMALDRLAEGTAFLMSSFDLEVHAQNRMQRFGVSASELVKGIPFTNYDGKILIYTKAYLDDLTTWKPNKMIANWYGPSLFILGNQDTTVKEAELRKAFELANEPKEFRTIESEHRFTNEHAMPIVETVVTWMEKRELVEINRK